MRAFERARNEVEVDVNDVWVLLERRALDPPSAAFVRSRSLAFTACASDVPGGSVFQRRRPAA